MTIIDIQELKDRSNTVRQFGNNVFARNNDIISVYEVMTYEKYEPKTLKDLNITYVITDVTTWEDVTNRFFGEPVEPDFKKVLKV